MVCTEAVLGCEAPSLRAIFGSPDDLKFCSCMTLFALAAGEKGGVFRRALGRWCDGQWDERTKALLRAGGEADGVGRR